MSIDHRGVRESLGVYVLGQLEPDEMVAVRAHLSGCADCRAEAEEIASVLPALRRVDPAALDATPVPPPDLGRRVIARAREEGRPPVRPGMIAAAAAAVVAVVLAAGAGYGLGASGSTPDGPREDLAVQAFVPGVQVAAVAIPHTWGVEISIDADGFAQGEVYRVVVRDDAGRAVNAGEFIGTGDQPMTCNLNSSVLRADASGFDVLDGRGALVVHGEL